MYKFNPGTCAPVAPTEENVKQFLEIMGSHVVTSTRAVATAFNREHKNVLRDVDALKKQLDDFSNYFSEDKEEDSQGRSQRVYHMNKDGFSLLVMGFNNTGTVLKWKKMFLKAFNTATKHYLESQNKILPSNISQMDVLRKMIDIIEEQDKKINTLEINQKKQGEKLQQTSEIIALRPSSKNWRTDIDKTIKRFALKRSDGIDTISFIYTRAYVILADRLHVNLLVRLNNLKKRAINAGTAYSVADKYNYLDVIASDPKLTESFIAIVKEVINDIPPEKVA